MPAIPQLWKKLRDIMLTQLNRFNHKRKGDVATMKSADFHKCRRVDTTGSVISDALSIWEKELVKVIYRIEGVGKSIYQKIALFLYCSQNT